MGGKIIPVDLGECLRTLFRAIEDLFLPSVALNLVLMLFAEKSLEILGLICSTVKYGMDKNSGESRSQFEVECCDLLKLTIFCFLDSNVLEGVSTTGALEIFRMFSNWASRFVLKVSASSGSAFFFGFLCFIVPSFCSAKTIDELSYCFSEVTLSFDCLFSDFVSVRVYLILLVDLFLLQCFSCLPINLKSSRSNVI